VCGSGYHSECTHFLRDVMGAGANRRWIAYQLYCGCICHRGQPKPQRTPVIWVAPTAHAPRSRSLHDICETALANNIVELHAECPAVECSCTCHTTKGGEANA
jgi:hypothetical protein